MKLLCFLRSTLDFSCVTLVEGKEDLLRQGPRAFSEILLQMSQNSSSVMAQVKERSQCTIFVVKASQKVMEVFHGAVRCTSRTDINRQIHLSSKQGKEREDGRPTCMRFFLDQRGQIQGTRKLWMMVIFIFTGAGDDFSDI